MRSFFSQKEWTDIHRAALVVLLLITLGLAIGFLTRDEDGPRRCFLFDGRNPVTGTRVYVSNQNWGHMDVVVWDLDTEVARVNGVTTLTSTRGWCE